MMFQHLFHRTKTPPPRFAQSLFLILMTVFILMLPSRPIVALAGLGTTLVLAAALVIFNRDRIWLEYKKSYKKAKSLSSVLTAPDKVYYNINIYFLWPFIAFLGVICLYVASIYPS